MNTDKTRFNIHLLRMGESLVNSINYVDYQDDLNKISSYIDYYFSRLGGKYYSCVLNYFKISNILQKVSFIDIDESSKSNEIFKKLNHESELDLIALLLRQLIEMYLSLKSISVTKHNKDMLDKICALVVLYNRYEYLKEQSKNAKDFSECDPLYLKELLKPFSDMDDYRNKASLKGFPILKNKKSMFKTIVSDSDYDKILLGRDFLSLYSFVSKKVHFSINSNFSTEYTSIEYYLVWCLLYFFEIYLECSKLLNFELYKDFNKTLDTYQILKDEITKKFDLSSKFTIGDIALFTGGIVEIVKVENFYVGISYLISSIFKTGTLDEIPTHFIMGKIDKVKYIELKNNYCSSSEDEKVQEYLLQNGKYEHFWKELAGKYYCV